MLRILGQVAERSPQPESDQVCTSAHCLHPSGQCLSFEHVLQVQRQALNATATSMLLFAADKTLQHYGVAAMLALACCNTRAVAPGVYDVNSTDKEGCTVLHK